MPTFQEQEYEVLDYCPMTPERMEAAQSIMRSGNAEIMRLHGNACQENKLGNKGYDGETFRKELFGWIGSLNGSLLPANRKRRKTPLRFVPSTTNNPIESFTIQEGRRVPVSRSRSIAVSFRAIDRIKAVQSIQNEVVKGFSRLIEQMATWFWSRRKRSSLAVQDYYDEGVFAVINAVYHYSRDDVAFITYVHHCIRHRMSRVANKDNPLSPWTNESRKLHGRYESAKSEINRPATFQEICEYCEFTDAEALLVQMTMSEVVNTSLIEVNGVVADSNALMVNGRNPDALSTSENSCLDLDQREAVKRARAKMTDFERALLDGFLEDGEHGWQARVAKSHINPNTGKPYSRMAPAVIWPRIVAMIQEEYEPEEPKSEVA